MSPDELAVTKPGVIRLFGARDAHGIARRERAVKRGHARIAWRGSTSPEMLRMVFAGR